MLPEVPVIESEYDEAEVEEHDTVAVPFVVKLVDEIGPQFRPEGTISVSETVPVSP